MQKQLDTDMEFTDEVGFMQRSEIVKKTVLGVLLVFVLAGLSGLLGYAPWTKIKKGSAEKFFVEYERFLRARKETQLRLLVHPRQGDTMVTVSLERNYLGKVGLQRISPQPSKATSDKNSIVLHFPSTGKSVQEFIFYTSALRWGNISSAISCNGEQHIIDQFIYP